MIIEGSIKTILDSFADCILLIDRDYKIAFANRQLLQLCGQKKEDVIGQKCHEFSHQCHLPCNPPHPPLIPPLARGDTEGFICPHADVFKTGKSTSVTHTHILPDGTERIFDITASPLKDEKGDVIQMLEVLRDVTEEKKTKEAMRIEKDIAQSYLDIAGVMFVVINAEEKVTLINKKGCEILGYRKEEIIGKNWFENFLPERMRDKVKNVFEKLIAGEIELVEYFENPVLNKSGKERIIAWHNTVLRDEKGKTIGTLSSGEDTTEHKKIEDELKKRIKELEEFYNMVVGRELKMMALKEEIKRLKEEIKKLTNDEPS